MKHLLKKQVTIRPKVHSLPIPLKYILNACIYRDSDEEDMDILNKYNEKNKFKIKLDTSDDEFDILDFVIYNSDIHEMSKLLKERYRQEIMNIQDREKYFQGLMEVKDIFEYQHQKNLFIDVKDITRRETNLEVIEYLQNPDSFLSHLLRVQMIPNRIWSKENVGGISSRIQNELKLYPLYGEMPLYSSTCFSGQIKLVTDKKLKNYNPEFSLQLEFQGGLNREFTKIKRRLEEIVQETKMFEID